MLPARYLLPRQPLANLSTKYQRRRYTSEPSPRPKSSHARLYSDIFPAMIPVFLLGSAVYLVRVLLLSSFCHQ